jgi:hypothetical protein
MIMEDLLNTFHQSLTKQIEGIHDPDEKLAIAVVLYIKIVDKEKEKALLLYQKSSSLDKISRSRVMQLEVEVSEIFKGIIEEGIEKGIFRDVDIDLMAYNIIMMAHMWALKTWHFKHRLDLDKYIDLQLVNIFNTLRKS